MRMLKCVEIANNHPNRLNKEGKEYLGYEIIEEMPIEEFNKFLKGYGYNRE